MGAPSGSPTQVRGRTDWSFVSETFSLSLEGPLGAIPVNWGWVPNGGWTVRGVHEGIRAFTDAFAHMVFPGSGLGGSLRNASGCLGRHEIHFCRELARSRLRDFVNDSLSESCIVESGLFDRGELLRVLNRWQRGEQGAYPTLVAALDISMAVRLFSQSPSLLTAPRSGRLPRHVSRIQ